LFYQKNNERDLLPRDGGGAGLSGEPAAWWTKLESLGKKLRR
jgi:hypothetical protein